MAIAFRSTSTGGNTSATTNTISLPAGTAVGDVTVLYATQATTLAAGGAVPIMTPPVGWTVLVASNGIIVCWRAYQAGDPTSGITFTSSINAWWASCAVAYSGCDTTAPIDAACFCYNISGAGGTQNNIYRAPSVLPNFNSDVLLVLHSNGESAARTLNQPAGTTQRANVTPGPVLRISEKTLVDGTPTGDIDTTCITTGGLHFGMSIALKTAGASGATLATARPTFGAIWNSAQNAATFTVPLDHLAVQNGDLVLVFTAGPGTTQALAGWTRPIAVLGANMQYRTWTTGDTTTPVFSVTAGVSAWVTVDTVVLRRAGSGTWNPTIDTSSVNSATSTVATPALTPVGSAEMLFTYFGNHVSTPAATWSGVTGGVNDIDINAAGPCIRFSSLVPSGSPTTAYSATLSGGNVIDAAAVLVGGAPAVAGAAQAYAMVLA